MQSVTFTRAVRLVPDEGPEAWKGLDLGRTEPELGENLDVVLALAGRHLVVLGRRLVREVPRAARYHHLAA